MRRPRTAAGRAPPSRSRAPLPCLTRGSLQAGDGRGAALLPAASLAAAAPASAAARDLAAAVAAAAAEAAWAEPPPPRCFLPRPPMTPRTGSGSGRERARGGGSGYRPPPPLPLAAPAERLAGGAAPRGELWERGKMADAFGDELFSVFEGDAAAARSKAGVAEAARGLG